MRIEGKKIGGSQIPIVIGAVGNVLSSIPWYVLRTRLLDWAWHLIRDLDICLLPTTFAYYFHSLRRHAAGLTLAAFTVWMPTVIHAMSSAEAPEAAKSHQSRSMRYAKFCSQGHGNGNEDHRCKVTGQHMEDPELAASEDLPDTDLFCSPFNNKLVALLLRK